MRIAFLTGTDKASLLRCLVGAGYDVAGLVTPARSERPSRLGRTIEAAESLGIDAQRVKKGALAELLRRMRPEVLLSAGFPYLLTGEEISVARWSINVHPTLLPEYRGAATAWHVIAHGERESGVTVHLMDAGMDTGAIVAQRRVPLSRFDTTRSLMRKTSEVEPQVTLEALRALESGDVPTRVQTGGSSFLEKRTPEDSRLDPSRRLLDLFDFIRACDPDRFPAFFEVDGERVGIRLFRLWRPEGEDDLL